MTIMTVRIFAAFLLCLMSFVGILYTADLKTSAQKVVESTLPMEILLTPTEIKDVEPLIEASQQEGRELQRLWDIVRLQGAANESDAYKLVLQIREHQLKLDLVNARAEKMLDKLRKAHNCETCDFKDGKTLIKPAPTKEEKEVKK